MSSSLPSWNAFQIFFGVGGCFPTLEASLKRVTAITERFKKYILQVIIVVQKLIAMDINSVQDLYTFFSF